MGYEDTKEFGVAQPEEAVQLEHGEESVRPGLADVDLSYGSEGLSGLVRSPYVLGAAVLASMGGFSFGYGMLAHHKCLLPL